MENARCGVVNLEANKGSCRGAGRVWAGNLALRAREIAIFSRHDAQTDCKPLVFSMVERRLWKLSNNALASEERKFAASFTPGSTLSSAALTTSVQSYAS